MRPESNQIKQNNQYRQLLMLKEQEVIRFMVNHIQGQNPHAAIYWGTFAALFFGLFALSLHGLYREHIDLRIFFINISGGVVLGSSLLVFLHEVLQAWLYKRWGASNLQFRFSLKRASFIVLAPHFVVYKKEHIQLVYLPFVLINGGLLVLLCLIAYPFKGAVLTAMLVHLLYCMRDFSILTYLANKSSYLTFDEEQELTTFVYEPSRKNK
jgi:hypothetical protein